MQSVYIIETFQASRWRELDMKRKVQWKQEGRWVYASNVKVIHTTNCAYHTGLKNQEDFAYLVKLLFPTFLPHKSNIIEISARQTTTLYKTQEIFITSLLKIFNTDWVQQEQSSNLLCKSHAVPNGSNLHVYDRPYYTRS